MKNSIRIGLTAVVVLVAILVVGLKYWDYILNPWTRDGQVRAYVIQIAPRVSGPIVDLPIVDNQLVRAGDLLFQIDPRTFQADLEKAEADLDQTLDTLASLDKEIEASEAAVQQSKSAIEQARAQVAAEAATLTEAEANLARFQTLLQKGDVAVARFEAEKRNYQVDLARKDRADAALLEAESALAQAQANLETALARRGAPGEENAQYRAARAALEQAHLNFEFTQQRAPVDGYVTNLALQLGSQATANQPAIALVDAESFWVDAYFQESDIAGIRPGDQAMVTLMSHPDLPFAAEVDSLAWGIAKDDGTTGANLLPKVNPTFQWIRLAQRVPVRIRLLTVPEGIDLRVGTTASVLVRSGTAE